MKAKSFKLKNQKNEIVSLSDFKNKWLVLYFYPKDMTNGCTIEAIEFSKAKNKFAKLNCEILGISPDPIDKHQKFIKKEDLKLNLLVDEEKNILQKYGVWKEKSMYGKKYMGVERSTFLIDPKGNIVFEWRKVKVNGHVDEVYNKLKELNE